MGSSPWAQTAEERIGEVEYVIRNIWNKIQRDKGIKKVEQNIQEIWDNYKRCNIHSGGMPKGEDTEVFAVIMTEWEQC